MTNRWRISQALQVTTTLYMGTEPVSAGEGRAGVMGREPVSAAPRGKESVLADSGHGEGTRFGASGGWAGVIAGEMVGGPAGVISVRALKVKECG